MFVCVPARVSTLSLELSRPTLQAGNVFALLSLVGVAVVIIIIIAPLFF